jgi:hypothetical protein
MKQGMNDFGHRGYGGPCPPKGRGPHRYNFILKALDVPTLGLRDGAKRGEVEMASTGHILAETRLTGRFERLKKRPSVRLGREGLKIRKFEKATLLSSRGRRGGG